MFNLDDYEPVENRIRAFWEVHPNGRILPDKPTLVLREDGKYQWECWTHVYVNKEDTIPTVRGFATEIEGSSPVNRTNAAENCETSSIGRALANLGFATKGKRPSREEMAKVNRVNVSSDDNPWEVSAPTPTPMAEAIDVVARELGAQPVPSCKHGFMDYKEGISSKTGKPYSGYTCPSKNPKDKCEARWNR